MKSIYWSLLALIVSFCPAPAGAQSLFYGNEFAGPGFPAEIQRVSGDIALSAGSLVAQPRFIDLDGPNRYDCPEETGSGPILCQCVANCGNAHQSVSAIATLALPRISDSYSIKVGVSFLRQIMVRPMFGFPSLQTVSHSAVVLFNYRGPGTYHWVKFTPSLQTAREGRPALRQLHCEMGSAVNGIWQPLTSTRTLCGSFAADDTAGLKNLALQIRGTRVRVEVNGNFAVGHVYPGSEFNYRKIGLMAEDSSSVVPFHYLRIFEE